MKKNLVIELYRFSLIDGITEESFLKAIHKAQTRFFKKQKGFIFSELLRSDTQWVNVSYWKSLEEAKQARIRFLEHSSCLPFVQMVSPISEKISYFDRVLRYTSNDS